MTDPELFVARGLAPTHCSHGRYVYIHEPTEGWYVWDGPHKAKLFRSAQDALLVAAECKGPWFNMPEEGSIEAVEPEPGVGRKE